VSVTTDPCLRRLFRGTRPIAGMAGDFARAAAGIGRLQVNLEDQPLLEYAGLRTLVDDPDMSRLEMALARLAAQPVDSLAPAAPEFPAGGPLHRARSDGYVRAVDDTPRTRRRIDSLLAASGSGTADPAGSDGGVGGTEPDAVPRTRATPSAGSVERPCATGHIAKDAARRALQRRARRAGAERALLRPVAPGARTKPAIAALVGGGRLDIEALHETIAEVVGEPAAVPTEPVGHAEQALGRIDELVSLILRRPAAGTSESRRARPDALSGDDARVSPVDAPDPASRPSALRRLARQAGTIAASPDRAGAERPVPSAGAAAQAPSGATGLAAADRFVAPGGSVAGDRHEMTRQLAEILRDEARRHGIDTEGVEL
jgi:hypothetical protein